MSDCPLSALAQLVRAKNAGPFWLTLDVFFQDDERYRLVAETGQISNEVVGALYGVDPDRVEIFLLPRIRVIKVSLPRPTVQGSFSDWDIHSGQHHVLLAALPIRVDSVGATGADHSGRKTADA